MGVENPALAKLEIGDRNFAWRKAGREFENMV